MFIFFSSGVSNVPLNESRLFLEKEQNRSCLDVLLLIKDLRPTLFHSVSETLSGKKQKSRKIVSTPLYYDSFQSRYVAHTDEQKGGRELEEKKRWAWHLAYSPDGELILNDWCCSDLTQLYITDGRCFPAEIVVELTERHLPLLCSEMGIRAAHDFSGFMV